MTNSYNKSLHMIAYILLVVGGINWLLLALFNWEIGQIFGGMTQPLSKLIYILVGASAIYEIATHSARCKDCKKDEIQKPAGM